MFGSASIESDLDPTLPSYLTTVLQRRQSFLRRMQTMRRLLAIFGLLMILLSVIISILDYFKSPNHEYGNSDITTILATSSYGFVFFGLAFLVNVSQAKQDVEDILSEIDLKNIGLEERERRAQKLFQLHQRELKRYYDQSLSQGLWIFFVGIICLILGFTVIGITLYEIFVSKSTTTDKIIIGVVGAVSGILTNFIAAIYMKMFGDTVKSATEFHNRLVSTHHLHFGNFLISKIEDNKLRDTALSEVSRAIAREPIPDSKKGSSRAKRGGKPNKEEEDNN